MAEEKFCAISGHGCHPNCEFKAERGDSVVCLITEGLRSVIEIEGATIDIAAYFIRRNIEEQMDKYGQVESIEVNRIDVNAIAKQKGID